MEDYLPYSTAVLAILFTLINLLLTLLNYLLGRGTQLRNLAAKYKDRLFEVNKLSIQYPDVASAFQSPETGSVGPVLESPKLDVSEAATEKQEELARARLAAQLSAYVRFRINFYEEIFYATQTGRLKALEDSKRWRAYIESRLVHPLVQEAILKEPGIYGEDFVKFAENCTIKPVTVIPEKRTGNDG